MTDEGKKAKEVGLRFKETMSGYLAEGVEDFEEGEKGVRSKEIPSPLMWSLRSRVSPISSNCQVKKPR